jgi:hypothetical protein
MKESITEVTTITFTPCCDSGESDVLRERSDVFIVKEKLLFSVKNDLMENLQRYQNRRRISAVMLRKRKTKK